MQRFSGILWRALAVVMILSPAALAAGGETAEQLQPILLGLVVIGLAARLGGELLSRMGQPSVLGELVIGILLGNLGLFGLDWLEPIKHDQTLVILAEIGVILLLFQVGLESTVAEMLKVGWNSLIVAILGVVAPFFLGWGVAEWFVPEESLLAKLFLGAVLCATSVGITARVLRDIGRNTSREARIILGAAVIDDILGLIILAVIVGLIQAAAAGSTAGVSILDVVKIFGTAVAFIVGAILLGRFVLPTVFEFGSRLKSPGVLLTLGLLLCFGLSFGALKIGMAPIIGAFAAGLILEPLHFKSYEARGEQSVEHLLEPIIQFLVPIFFVRMGMQVDLTTFANVGILGFAVVLTIAAVIGKQVCSLGVWDRSLNRLAIGIGMIPRGEVGLIFAGIGATLVLDGHRVITPEIYSAIIIMVVVTTFLTPPVLSAVMKRGETPRAEPPVEEPLEQTP